MVYLITECRNKVEVLGLLWLNIVLSSWTSDYTNVLKTEIL